MFREKRSQGGDDGGHESTAAELLDQGDGWERGSEERMCRTL